MEDYLGKSGPVTDVLIADLSNITHTQVQLVITLLPTNAKDDLAQFSNSKFIGSYQLQLDGERELQGYTVRTFKVGTTISRNQRHTLSRNQRQTISRNHNI